MSIIEPRTATVEIFTGDYLDRINYLEQRAEAAKEAADQAGPRSTATCRSTSSSPASTTSSSPRPGRRAEVRSRRCPGACGRRWSPPTRRAPSTHRRGHRPGGGRRRARGVNVDTFKDALVYGGTVDVDGEPTPYQSVIEPDDLTRGPRPARGHRLRPALLRRDGAEPGRHAGPKSLPRLATDPDERRDLELANGSGSPFVVSGAGSRSRPTRSRVDRRRSTGRLGHRDGAGVRRRPSVTPGTRSSSTRPRSARTAATTGRSARAPRGSRATGTTSARTSAT
jgi:hypothetical protein